MKKHLPFAFAAFTLLLMILALLQPVSVRAQQRYLGPSLVNENDQDQTALIQQSKAAGCNAVFLTVQWGAIHGYISRYQIQQHGSNYNLWQMYDDQIALARSLGMKVGINIAVSTGDNVTHSETDRYGINTGDGWLKEERMLTIAPNGSEGVYQKWGGFFHGVPLQLVMTSLAAQSTKDRIVSFTNEVVQRYKYLQNTNELLYMNLIYTRSGEGEFDMGSTKYQFNTPIPDLEYGLNDYSQPMVNAYRTWLTAKYSDIQILRDAWGQQNIASFSSINPKKPQDSTFTGQDGRDWYLFRNQVLKETNTLFNNTVKAADNRIKVIAHHGSVFDKLSSKRNTFLFPETAQGLDGMKVNDDNNHDHRFSMDVLRTNLPGKIIINEAAYAEPAENEPQLIPGRIASVINHISQSFDHGAHMVSIMFTEGLFQDGGASAISTVAAQKVNNQQVSYFSPTNTDSYTLSNMIARDGCKATGSLSDECDAYLKWRTAYANAGNQPVNIFLENDFTQTGCPAAVTASTSSSSPTTGSTITLSANCTNCTGAVTYTWKKGTTTIGTGATLSYPVGNVAGTDNYTVTVSKSACTAKTSPSISISVVAPPQGGCYTMRIAGGTQEFLTRETGNVLKVRNANNANNQKWTFETVNGFTRIVADNGMVLGVVNGGNSSGNKIELQASGSEDHKLWSRAAVAGGFEVLTRKGNSSLLIATEQFGNGVDATNVSDLSLQPYDLAFGANKWTIASCTTTPVCPTAVTASTSNTSPVAGSTITLSANCTNCTGAVTYTWKKGTTTIGTGATLSYPVGSVVETANYTVTVSKSQCTDRTSAPISISVVAPPQGNCYTMRVAGGTQEFLTRETGNVLKVRNANNANNQKWTFETVNGFTRIVADNGMVLGVVNGGNSSGNKIELQTSGSEDHKLWSRAAVAGGFEVLTRKGNSSLLIATEQFGNGVDATNVSDLSLQPYDLAFGANKWTIASCTTTPVCPTAVTASTSTTSATAGSTITLSANCTNCTGAVTYTWKKGTTTIGTGATLSYAVGSVAGTANYTVTVSKSECTDRTSAPISISIVPNNCYTMRVAGGTQEFLTRETGNVLKVRNANNANNQKWTFETVNGFTRIVADNGMVLGVVNGGNSSGNKIELQASGTEDHKLWSRAAVSGGYEVLTRKGNSSLLIATEQFGNGVDATNVSDLSLQPYDLAFGANKWTIAGCSTSGASARIAGIPEDAVADPGAFVSELSVSPNPTNGSFEASFYLDTDEPAILSVINLLGQTITKQTVTGAGRHKEKVAITTPSSGTVIVQLQTHDKLLAKKVIVLR